MDNEKDKKETAVTEGLKHAMANGSVDIVFREGKANPLPDPIKPQFSGIITSPSDYMVSRPDEFSIENSLCLFDRNSMTISLTDNTRNNYAVSVVGKLELSKTLKSISINKGKKYKPDELAQLLRLKRTWFKDFTSHAAILSQLKSVKAKVNTEIERSSDNGGNKSELFKQAVESNMPDSFVFKSAIFEGEEEHEFNVDFVLSVDGGDIVCELESMELEEAIESGVKLIFDREQNIIKDRAAIIFSS